MNTQAKRCFRLIAVFLCVAIVVLIPFTISAEERVKKADSLNITSEEMSQLKIPYTPYPHAKVQVVKKYVTAFTFLFPGMEDVDELLVSNEIISEHFLILLNDEIVSHQRIFKGNLENVENVTEVQSAKDEKIVQIMNAGNDLLAKISTEIEVYQTYYFFDTTGLDSCIYFETSDGDYVYWKSYVVGGECLFPAEIFVQLVTLVFEERGKYPDQVGSGVHITDYMDLSKYNMNSPSFDLSADSDPQDESDNDNNAGDKTKLFDNKFVLWGAVSVGCIVIATAAFFIMKRIIRIRRSSV